MSGRRKFMVFVWTVIVVTAVIGSSAVMWDQQRVHEQMSSSYRIWSVWGDVSLGLIVLTIWVLVTSTVVNPQ